MYSNSQTGQGSRLDIMNVLHFLTNRPLELSLLESGITVKKGLLYCQNKWKWKTVPDLLLWEGQFWPVGGWVDWLEWLDGNLTDMFLQQELLFFLTCNN